MKKIIMILLLILAISCSKDESNPQTEESSIYGKWELYSYVYEDGSDYFDEVENKDQIDTIEFLSPNTYHWRYLHDYPTIYDAIGNFTLIGDILTFNETSYGGDASDDKTVVIDVVIKNGVSEYTENIAWSGQAPIYGRAYYKKIN